MRECLKKELKAVSLGESPRYTLGIIYSPPYLPPVYHTLGASVKVNSISTQRKALDVCY